MEITLLNETLKTLRKQSPPVQARANELFRRHVDACTALDVRVDSPDRALIEAIDAALTEERNPSERAWYDAPVNVEKFLVRYRQYDAPKDVLVK